MKEKIMKTRDYQVWEVLDEIEKLETDMARVDRLRDFSDHTPLQYMLKWNFCETVRSLLPEGTPPYNNDQTDGPSPASLWSYLKVFPRFVDCPEGNSTSALQRERMFIEMLEAVDVDEAAMICLMKDGNYNGIDLSVVNTAFPDLITNPNAKVIEKTSEERAEEMKLYAEQLKKQAKELNSQARQLTAEAKDLLKSEA
jgi:hypothetical protein